MKKICWLILSVFCLVSASQTAQAQQATPNEFHIIYSFMKGRNVAALQNAINNGVWIDAPDSNGINSLCHTIYQKDYEGYELLKSLQADTSPACLHRMSAKYKNAFYADFTQTNRYAYLEPEVKEPFITPKVETAGTLAAFGTAGIVAIALNGGSGTGGGENEGGGEEGGGGETGKNPALDNLPAAAYFKAPKNDDPTTFKTAEFEKGNFLSPIKAEYAYARGYTGYKVERTVTPSTTEGGEDTVDFDISTNKMTIAIYDDGVDSNHSKLSPNILTNSNGDKVGYNFDYGPCSTVNNKACYQYDSARQVLQFKSENGTISDVYSEVSTEVWSEYVNTFNSNYVWNEKDSSPHQVEDVANPDEYSSHGTHVAGIAGATSDGNGMHGVAYNVNLLPIIYNQFGSFADIALNLDSITEHIDIVNMSFGPDSSSSMNATNSDEYITNTEALTNIFDKNIILVIAAGNESESEPNAISGIPSKVANAENLFITVVSVDANGNLTDYSNKCGSAAKWCIAAPGGTVSDPIYSTANDNNYAEMSGTSMAAPSVSGSLALLLSAFPNLTPQQAVAILLETAGNADGTYNSDVGHGLLNLDAATNPIGSLNIASTNSTTNSLLSLSNTVVSLPYNMASLTNKLPEKFIVLDKYSRPYPFATKALFNTADNDETLMNNMKYFTNNKPTQKISLNDNVSMSFSNRVTNITDSNLQLGSMSFDYNISNQATMGFFYNENTLYKNGNYFSKATSNPFLNINDAFGIKNDYQFNHQMNMNIAVYTGKNGFYNDDHRMRIQNDNRFNAIDYTLNYAPTSFLNFGLKSGFLQESGSILGIKGSGALSTDDTLTAYNGIEISLMPTDKLSVTATYYQGKSKTNGADNSLVSLSDLTSESMSLDFGYQMDELTKLGLQVISPLGISAGEMMLDLPVGRDPIADKVFREKYNISMEPAAREIDLGIYFTHETSDEQWFRAEFMTRLNPDNQNVNPDYMLMLGYGVAF